MCIGGYEASVCFIGGCMCMSVCRVTVVCIVLLCGWLKLGIDVVARENDLTLGCWHFRLLCGCPVFGLNMWYVLDGDGAFWYRFVLRDVVWFWVFGGSLCGSGN